jgi:uncharacterized membrane protein
VKSAIDLAFAALCHHAPERTLTLAGESMCVCSRCAGLYAGVLLAALWPWAMSWTRPRLVLSSGAVLMVTDVLSQDLGLHPPWHAVRLATGFVVGYAAAAWMLSELERSRRSGGEVDGRQTVTG